MNKLRFYLVALATLFVFSVRADEGMWLLQLMQQQHSIDMMKKQVVCSVILPSPWFVFGFLHK